MVSLHLLQRIYGTMISAAPDPIAARAVVDRAESTIGISDLCEFCSIMLAVPATIACADSGDIPHAHHHLAVAERSAKLWSGTAWEAGLVGARAHVAIAELEPVTGELLLANAAEQFDLVAHPLDAERCWRGVEVACPNS
jgi:hypothetical protein